MGERKRDRRYIDGDRVEDRVSCRSNIVFDGTRI